MSLTVGGVTLGEGRPKIIVPVYADREEVAVNRAALLGDSAADLAELRLDPLREPEDVLPDVAALRRTIRRVRSALAPRIPLLVTLRTKAEGGDREVTPDQYGELLRGLLPAAYSFQLLDIEYRTAGGAMTRLCHEAQEAGLTVVGSMHEFFRTPPEDDMALALCTMGDAGADIAKLAVMPDSRVEAAALLAATARAHVIRPTLPLITMAMGAHGAVTRVCGGAFGSCATFGTAGTASAPGQPDADALRAALDALDACLA